MDRRKFLGLAASGLVVPSSLGLPPAFTDPLMEIVRLARAMPHEPESLSIDLGDGPKALALLGASADTMHVSVKRHGIMWRGNLACSRCEDWRFGSVEGDEQIARLASLIAKVGEPGAGVRLGWFRPNVVKYLAELGAHVEVRTSLGRRAASTKIAGVRFLAECPLGSA